MVISLSMSMLRMTVIVNQLYFMVILSSMFMLRMTVIIIVNIMIIKTKFEGFIPKFFFINHIKVISFFFQFLKIYFFHFQLIVLIQY